VSSWLAFALTLAFNAGIAWALVRVAARKAEHLAQSVESLSLTVTALNASMATRHEENLRRFARLEERA
jgi:hypothetical protein